MMESNILTISGGFENGSQNPTKLEAIAGPGIYHNEFSTNYWYFGINYYSPRNQTITYNHLDSFSECLPYKDSIHSLLRIMNVDQIEQYA
jgi:hypothetical protein